MNYQEHPAQTARVTQTDRAAQTTILEARHVSRYFTRSSGFLSRKRSFAAVHDVSLNVKKGITLGIIGESGCGKSTLAKMLAGLLPPSAGEIRIHNTPMYTGKSHGGLTSLNPAICKTVQMVFQDPNASLNPRMRIGESVGEPLRCLYPETPSAERQAQVKRVLAEVGIAPEYANRYPHAFSGGQRQRIAIARALIAKPSVIICDEPTSSLDSSVQAQVLNLLDISQKRHEVAYVFISHDLAVVRHMSDEVAVMYNGSIVETGSVQDVFSTPAHPYTHLLLDSVPTLTTFKLLDGSKTTLSSPLLSNTMEHIPVHETAKGIGTETGNDPDRVTGKKIDSDTTAGCLFAPRCPRATSRCFQNVPELVPLGETTGNCEVTGHPCPTPTSPTPTFPDPNAVSSINGPPHCVRCFLARDFWAR